MDLAAERKEFDQIITMTPRPPPPRDKECLPPVSTATVSRITCSHCRDWYVLLQEQ